MSQEFLSLLIVTLVAQVASGGKPNLLPTASSEFSQKLYQQVAINMKNIVYSPYSIHSILTLTYYGAKEPTATEMKNVLSLKLLTGSSPHKAYQDLIKKLSGAKGVELKSANALYINFYHILPAFAAVAKAEFFTQASNINLTYLGGPEIPVNKYIAEKTNNVFTNFLQKDFIKLNSSILLVSTLCFSGKWAKPFNKQATRNQAFSMLNGSTVQLPTMNEVKSVGLKKDDKRGIDVVELPFANKRFALYIALPREVKGITKLESLLKTSSDVDELFNGLVPTSVWVSIPRFKIETTLRLNDPLTKMGMTSAFGLGKANFRGIDPSGRSLISEVLHKAVIAVQESGAVTVAATAADVSATQRATPRSTASFVANHPFIFFLRDQQTKLILLQGKFSGWLKP